MRHHILYADQMWRKQRFWALFLVLVGLVMSFYLIIYRRQPLNTNTYIWLAYVPSGLLLLGILQYYKWRSFVQATDAGLKVSNLMSSVMIDYQSIRGVRVGPLNQHFAEGRKKMARPVAKALLEQPALFVRLRGDDLQLAAITRKLGSQLASYDTIALPLPDPDAMAWELNSRLPDRLGVNLGGGRRRKKRR